MRIKLASEEDKPLWDSFVESQQGSFYYYFDFRQLNKHTIQLIIETDLSRMVCVCCFQREERALYSFLRMGEILFRKDQTEDERYLITLEILRYIEKNYSKKCSAFYVTQEIKADSAADTSSKDAFRDCGFRLINSVEPSLPCVYILPLKTPFEEHIWQGLWTRKLRVDIMRVVKKGARVIQDPGLNYFENFFNMVAANHKRLRIARPDKLKMIAQYNLFKDKTKYFVTIMNDQPIVILKCHYTPSTCYLAEVGSYDKDTGYANKLCYKAAIEDACNSGYQFVNFGYTQTEGLAFFKERFKGVRICFKNYEKRYSIIRVLMELISSFLYNCLHDKTYLWKRRKYIWNSIVRW